MNDQPPILGIHDELMSHEEYAAQILGCSVADITAEQRRVAKMLRLGHHYGLRPELRERLMQQLRGELQSAGRGVLHHDFEEAEVRVIGRREGKTDMIREHVEAGGRVLSVGDCCPPELKKALLAPAGLGYEFVSFDELARCLPNPGDNWLNIGIPSHGEDSHALLYKSSLDEVRRGMSYHPAAHCLWGAPPKVGKPGAKMLKARRERNKTAAKSRRRNRG